MDVFNPELNRKLAAEYVLGTLQGAARRRFERLMSDSTELRSEVGFWELRLSELGQITIPIEPPPQARVKLSAFIDNTRTTPLSPARPAIQVMHRPAFFTRRNRIAAALAASLLVLAFLVGQKFSQSSTASTELASIHPTKSTIATSMLPMYVTALRMPASSMRWLISVTPDHHHLTVEAAEDYLQLGRFSVELWWMSDRGPVALGVLPTTTDDVASIAMPKDLAQQGQATFTISLEPQGGSPTGKMTGFELDSAPDSGSI